MTTESQVLKRNTYIFLKVDNSTTSCKPRNLSKVNITNPSTTLYTLARQKPFHTNMATTLENGDSILGDEMDIGGQICILVATQGDATPLCPSSFKEEDILKLCIGIGQEPPEDVLILSNTKTILGFRCKADMMATTCHCNVAMVW